MINFKQMMQQAQQMQFKLQELQEKFKDIDVEASSGDGLVRVVISCAGLVRSITIEPSLMGSDKETLEDLVTVAVNSAVMAKEARIQDETKKMMRDMGIDENTKLPF